MSRRWLTLKLRAYRKGDEIAFDPRPDMALEHERVDWSFSALGPPGPTWALVRSSDGKVMGVGGGVEQRRGDWELWCVLAPLRVRDWPAACACAVEVVRRLERDWRARRLTALARDDFAPARLVLRRMGFAYFGVSPSWPGYSVFERRHRNISRWPA